MGLHAFHRREGSDYGTGPANPGASGAPDSFGATASFDVYKGLTNVGPTWTLVHFLGPVGGAGYERDDLHKLAITFVPVAAPSPAASVHGRRMAAIRPASFAQAAFAAQFANQQLVQTQAIQHLGQILSVNHRF